MHSAIMDIPLVPNQPKTFTFPKCSFGQKNIVRRSFQSSWLANTTWLHYDEANDSKLSSANMDEAFITMGYCNWKDARVAFKNMTPPTAIVSL